MIHVIVPVKNEELKIIQTLNMLLATCCDKIIVVLNGCEDRSLQIVEGFVHEKIDYIYFNKSLGVDIPRTIGAQLAMKDNTDGIVFVDGDMNGRIEKHVNEIIYALKEKKMDMALTNCYPKKEKISYLASMLLSFRKLLNLELNIFERISYSTPSHGPHGLSRRFLETIPLRELAIPPVSLALAVENQLLVDIATTIPVSLLSSTTRDTFHANQIAKTIIGDCIEAVQFFNGKERTRCCGGITFTGYHKNRRFDILESYLSSF